MKYISKQQGHKGQRGSTERGGGKRWLAVGTTAAGCPPESCCPSPPSLLLAHALAQGAGSGQPGQGGSGRGSKSAVKEQDKLAGSWQRLWRGLKHQPLRAGLLQRSGQAVKVFLPWGSGSAELGGKQGRWSELSRDSRTGAYTNMRLLQHP